MGEDDSSEFSRVPGPDPGHQKIVARSPLGRLIGFAQGFALAIAGFLLAAILLDHVVVSYFTPLSSSPARILIVLSIPVLAAVALYLSVRQRPRPSLFMQIEMAKPNYFRITPYEEKDRDVFRRADGTHMRVLNWLEKTATEAAPLYLTGDSGTGKSSLLNAFVIPTLQKGGWIVQIQRTFDDPEAAALRALAAAESEKADGTDNRRGSSQRELGTLLVLDQFEEFVILQDRAPQDALRRFQAFLKQLQTKQVQDLRLLLVLRKDYEPFIERLGLPQLRHDGNWRQVGRFDIAEARAFIAESGLGLSEHDIEDLLISASKLDETPRLIRPVTLNILGFILSKGRADWKQTRSADALIRDYVRDTLRDRSIRDYGPRLLRLMVTDVGTSRACTLSELAEQTGIDLALARVALINLADKGLTRPLGAEEETWEVSHDFVARLLVQELPRRSPMLRGLREGDAAKARRIAEARRLAEAHARAALADMGLFTREKYGGLQLTSEIDLSNSLLDRARPYLALLAPRLFRASLAGVVANDFAFLAGLPKLRSLNLTDTEVISLEPLAQLTALKELNLRRVLFGGVAVMDGVDTNLSVSPNFLAFQRFMQQSGGVVISPPPAARWVSASIKSLKGLTALQELILAGTQVNDVSPLASLSNLQKLDLAGTQVNDVSPLASLSNLQKLDLADTQVSDVSLLAHLSNLQKLDLASTQVSNVSQLAGLSNLQELNLTGTRVNDVSPLARLSTLQKLDLAGTPVSNVSPLARLSNLQELSLTGTRVNDISPLARLSNLQKLNLARTQVSDISPLVGLSNLQKLNLTGTRVNDVSPLNHLYGLEIVGRPADSYKTRS